MSNCRLVTCLGIVATLFAIPVRAQLTPLGEELSISSTVDKTRQLWPAVATSPTGTWVVWEDDSVGIVSGVVTTPELAVGTPAILAANDPLPAQKPFRVNLREHHQPALAVRGDGSVLLVWTETTVFRNVSAAYVDERTTVSSRVLGRQFAADGQPRGEAFEIAAGKGGPARPVLAAAGDDAWVAWEESEGAGAGIHLRSLDAKGHLGKDVLAGAGGRNAALATAGKDVLVAWDHVDQQERSTVFARLFKPSGSPVGAATELRGAGAGSTGLPAAAAAPNGDFFLAWQAGPDATFRDSHVDRQLLRPKGSAITLVGTPQTISIGDGNRHMTPVVAALHDGGWLAEWVAWNGLVPLAVDVARLDAAGAVVGKPVRLNDRRPFERGTIAMAAQAGRVWASWVSVGPDGRSRIRARVVSTEPATATAAAAGSPAAH